MHHCLQIDEIIRHIFSFVDNARLRLLAQTCRNFNEPATDLLWRTFYGIDSLYPLLSCVGEVVDDATKKSTQTIIRPLNDVDWRVIERYTRKARSLYINLSGLPVDVKVVQSLANSPSPDLLFPNLQVLSINLEGATCNSRVTDTAMAFAQLLSRRNISRLYLNFEGHQTTHFKLGLRSPSYPFIEVAGLSVTRASSLLPWLDPKQFVSCTISCWEELLEHGLEVWNEVEKLRVRTSTCPNHSLLERSLISHRLLPKLNTFILHESAPTALKIMSSTRLDQLTSLSISMPQHSWDDESYSQELKEILVLIPSKYPLLESLQITSTVVPLNSSAFVLEQSTIEPCLCLRHLRTLAIQTYYHIDLSDCFIEKMGQAWPRLEHLHLRRSNSKTTPTRLTSLGVANFIGCSPRLRTFSLSVDFASGMCPRPAESTVIRGSNVWLADFCGSYISTKVPIAEYLSNLLPHLTYLGVPAGRKARTRAWRKVAKRHRNQPLAEVVNGRIRRVLAGHGEASDGMGY
ncbi:hypothetical protein BKA82DRAFT_30380 [Pisolithus tinctorius]|nr:hypothetical protein BKA82DRAFT_30380 [Pisolithus tinctorius]